MGGLFCKTFTYMFLRRWLTDSRSDKRVAWLMIHGKNERIRMKNFKRAYRIASRNGMGGIYA